jgi:hypothetical protein
LTVFLFGQLFLPFSLQLLRFEAVTVRRLTFQKRLSSSSSGTKSQGLNQAQISKRNPFQPVLSSLARSNESCLKAGFDCKLGSEWINCRYYLHFNPRKVKYKLVGSENLNRGTLAEVNRHSKKKDEDGLRKYFENHEYV